MLVLIRQISPKIIGRRFLKEIVQYDLYTYTHPECENRLQVCEKTWTYIIVFETFAIEHGPVAAKYLKQQRNDLTHKVTPTRPISVLNDSRAASSRTMIPGNSRSAIHRQAKLVLNTLIGPQLQESPTVNQGYINFSHFGKDLKHAHDVVRKNSRPCGRPSPWKNLGNSFPTTPASGRRRSMAPGNRCINWMMAFAHLTIPPWER